MAKFLKGNELNAELEKILETAKKQIILISPYIKLHNRYKATLLTKIDKPNLEIILLFGKNKEDISKSMKQDDFDFFKQFPNIEIRYEERLHAKYYANETKALLTSMNLYGFSQNNNIEAGVLMESSFKGLIPSENEMSKNSREYFKIVLEQAELLYKKEPIFENKYLFFFKKFMKSEIKEDKLSDFFNKKNSSEKIKKTKDYNDENKGFCIRTGIKIPFNIEKPMSYEAFKEWSKGRDADYPEKYCHFSGELSNGKTSVNKPILKKNWDKAKAKYNI